MGDLQKFSDGRARVVEDDPVRGVHLYLLHDEFGESRPTFADPEERRIVVVLCNQGEWVAEGALELGYNVRYRDCPHQEGRLVLSQGECGAS